MKKKISKRLLGTATLAILATVLLTVAVCYHMFKNQVMEDLKVYAKMVSCLAEQTGEAANKDYLSEMLGEGSEKYQADLLEDHIRITLIAEDGSVIYDTESVPEKMENHKDRPEIKQAAAYGEGSEVRKSDTLDRNTYYYAMSLENEMFLRVSRDADSIYRMMKSAVPYMLTMIMVLFVVCWVLSWFMAEGIMRPVKLIALNMENVEQMQVYEEMKPFIEAIKNQHEDVIQNAKIRQEFTANVSHELKTPLTAISGYSELMENGMVTEESEMKRFAKEIHSNANRLLTLINDVIRLSELDAEDRKESMEPVNLMESAKTCVNMLQMNAQKHHVSLTLEGESAVIMADRQMIDEVLYNLCDNAIRYNREEGTVRVIVRACPDTVLLIVKDTGIGIPKEHQERIFERFYRVDKSRSKSTGGTGLGLAIVKHMLIQLDAEISLESELDKGTEITVKFPGKRETKSV